MKWRFVYAESGQSLWSIAGERDDGNARMNSSFEAGSEREAELMAEICALNHAGADEYEVIREHG